ncbi:MAG: cupin domain-containing protein [Aestuariivirga sp.]
MSDPLSDVLRSVRLKGGVFLDVEVTAPWSVLSAIGPEDCGYLLQGPAQIIAYHLVIEGRMLLSVEGEPAIEVSAGEIVLLPRNDAHNIGSAAGLKPVDGHTLIEPSPGGGVARVRAGGGGAMTKMVCGFLGSDETFSPLIASLPRVLTLDVKGLASRGLIEASLAFAVSELVHGRLASSDVMSRVSELLLVEAVRLYAERNDAKEGWLRGLKDPQIGKALALLHGDLAASWSADGLASSVAMSRSAFMNRFAQLVGQPPMQYLTSQRLATARRLLSGTPKSIGQIAPMVGYESEEAFSRAFKREFGIAPAHWREQAA